MGYIIDVIYTLREILRLTFMIAISPMGIIAALLLIEPTHF